jgi:hypothetical protein
LAIIQTWVALLTQALICPGHGPCWDNGTEECIRKYHKTCIWAANTWVNLAEQWIPPPSTSLRKWWGEIYIFSPITSSINHPRTKSLWKNACKFMQKSKYNKILYNSLDK